jgi:hypothetical protein
LFSLIKALSGVNEFTSEENGYILSFINRRADEAYDSSQMWPRYLIVGEERTVDTNNIVAYTQTSKNDIAEFIRIHRTQPFDRQSVVEYDYYVTGSGAHILNIAGSDNTSVYVTYKKKLDEITEGSTIPLEFFYFIAHASYADFLRMDGQIEKAVLEENVARTYLDLELGKLDNIANNNSINKKISTYVNRQTR